MVDSMISKGARTTFTLTTLASMDTRGMLVACAPAAYGARRIQELTSMVARITLIALIPTVCNVFLQTHR